jgi:hypothetical protein
MSLERLSPGLCAECGGAIRYCRSLLAWLEADFVTWEEFAYNLVVQLVRTCDGCMQAFVDSLTTQVASKFYDYLRAFLEPVDFMPCPRPFIAGVASEERVQQMKETLKPRYVRLYLSVKART